MDHKIVLADDHQIIRDGLRSMLATEPGFQVIGEAKDGRSAVELVLKLEPNLVIMDIGMPGLNGIEATLQITKEKPETKVIALSMHSDAQFVGRMLEAGASAYLLKEGTFDELRNAMQSVLNGQIYLSRGITGVVVEDYLRQRTAQRRPILNSLPRRSKWLATSGHAQ